VSVPPDQISAQLDRILASPGFASADRASRFLRYVVERTVAGEGDQLKEYVIGRAVFDRGDDYDPRIDSIVRVEAGRLRSKIDEYYSGAGRADDVLIQLRRGSYAPAFETRGGEAARATSADAANGTRRVAHSRFGRNLGLAAAALVIVALVAWRAGMFATAERTPPIATIAVLPFSNYSADTSEQLLAARVTDDLTAELARLGTLGVVSHTSALQYADVRPRPSVREIARTLNAQLIMEGRVRDESGRINIQVILVDAALDRKVWVHSVEGNLSDLPKMERQLAQDAFTAIQQRRK
jgi:TolB-like protein